MLRGEHPRHGGERSARAGVDALRPPGGFGVAQSGLTPPVVSGLILLSVDLAWGLLVSWNDEGPGRQLFEPDDGCEAMSLGDGSAASTPDTAREVDALLSAGDPPPAKVWRKLQAKLRSEGIIR